MFADIIQVLGIDNVNKIEQADVMMAFIHCSKGDR